jgi:hypothetical protein
MKHLKYRFFKIALLTYLSTIVKISLATISGPQFITPGSNNVFQVTNVQGAHTFNWTSNGNNVTLTNISTQVVTVNANKNTTSCTFVLTVTYKIGSATNLTTENLPIEILPHIVAPATISPGGSVMANIATVCNTYVSCSINWVVLPGASCSPCGNAFSQSITCPLSGFPNVINLNGNLNCFGLPWLGSQSVAGVNITVILQDPANIAGPAQIGCNGLPTGNQVYTASSVQGAAWWVWTLPGNLFTVVSGQNAQSITLNPVNVGQGNISVQAFASNGSPVKSNTISKPVQVCCVGNTFVTATVYSGLTDNREAAGYLQATNSIMSGGTARYHGGDEVKLLPGFESISGSVFHAYIEGCTQTFTNRMMDTSITVLQSNDYNTNLSGSAMSEETSFHLALESNPEENESRPYKISVYPNPNKGSFICWSNSEDERTIFVVDILGNTVYLVEHVMAKIINIDISNQQSGVYFVKNVYSSGYSDVKKVILN